MNERHKRLIEKIKKEKEENIKKSIGEKIKKYRKNLGLTQIELAEKVGVKSLSILKYEKGERDIPFSLLVKICNVLNINIKEFEFFFKNGYINSWRNFLAEQNSNLDNIIQIAFIDYLESYGYHIERQGFSIAAKERKEPEIVKIFLENEQKYELKYEDFFKFLFIGSMQTSDFIRNFFTAYNLNKLK